MKNEMAGFVDYVNEKVLPQIGDDLGVVILFSLVPGAKDDREGFNIKMSLPDNKKDVRVVDVLDRMIPKVWRRFPNQTKILQDYVDKWK